MAITVLEWIFHWYSLYSDTGRASGIACEIVARIDGKVLYV